MSSVSFTVSSFRMQAIILSRRDIREHDQIVSLYTEERGKLELFARGIKKMASKNASSLEPYTWNHVGTVRGRQIEYVTSVQPIRFFPILRTDAKRSGAAWYFMWFLDVLIPAGGGDKALFKLVLSWLEYLEEERVDRHVLLLDAVIFKFIALLGFRPTFDACYRCEKSVDGMTREFLCLPLEDQKKFVVYVSLGDGGVMCADCFTAHTQKDTRIDTFVSTHISDMHDLRLLLHGTWGAISTSPIGGVSHSHLHHIIYRFAQFHTERHLPDWEHWLRSLTGEAVT